MSSISTVRNLSALLLGTGTKPSAPALGVELERIVGANEGMSIGAVSEVRLLSGGDG